MDSILSDEPSVHSLPDDAGQSAPEAAEPEETTTDKVEAAPEEAPKPAETAGDDDSDDGPEPTDFDGFKRAMAAVRGDKRKLKTKWQEVEKQNARLEGELAALRRQGTQPAVRPEPEAAKPGFWDSDPEKYIQERLKSELDSFQKQSRSLMIERDERAMRRQHTDYEEVSNAFSAAAQNNPQLLAAFRADPDPVGFAYEQGKQLMRLQHHGATSVTELEAKIRAEVTAELESKRSEPSEPQRQPARPPIPKSIAGSRGSGAGIPAAWSGPRSLNQILGS